ncbi:hypothetical protein C2G38_2191275 [Gigaspora rosea]|uniref:Uncharacterized protein n=1 Tax=Gigaspora rosea TaxID=44941 RepID=A0A397V7J1_9GLOM|nr:hypothetical protein C2G38_2191275 [Gigaspora rosea]
MSASGKKTTHPEAYTLLLKVYQEANSTKKRDIAIREAQDLWNELKERNTLKHMEEQARASSTTIAKDTTEDIL